jgi:hypothetical protein
MSPAVWLDRQDRGAVVGRSLCLDPETFHC